MNAGFGWMLAGIVLCGAELVHPGAFLLWIGIAAVATGGVTLAVGLESPTQVLVCMAVLTILLCIPTVRRWGRAARPGGINAPDYDLIGKTCRAISFVGGEGRVRLRDGAWHARTTDEMAPAPGTILRVVALDGTTLVVEASDQPPS